MIETIRILLAAETIQDCDLLAGLLRPDSELAIIGEALTSGQTVSMTRNLKPSLILMDGLALDRGGLEATRRIMSESPTPIVIASDRGVGSVDTPEKLALDAGALLIIRRPLDVAAPEYAQLSQDAITAVRTMAPVKLVRRRPDRFVPVSPQSLAMPDQPLPDLPLPDLPMQRRRIVAIAASTGGPAALQQLLTSLPRDFPLPILVVQHIARGFTSGLVGWLGQGCRLRVKLAEEGELVLPGSVYVAPENRHLGITNRAIVRLSDEPPIRGFRPSATFLFDSVATSFGNTTVSVVLTGMGDDGVSGLRSVRTQGGFVMAQDEASSVVFGMPGSAVQAGLANLVARPAEIAAALVRLAVPATE